MHLELLLRAPEARQARLHVEIFSPLELTLVGPVCLSVYLSLAALLCVEPTSANGMEPKARN